MGRIGDDQKNSKGIPLPADRIQSFGEDEMSIAEIDEGHCLEIKQNLSEQAKVYVFIDHVTYARYITMYYINYSFHFGGKPPN